MTLRPISRARSISRSAYGITVLAVLGCLTVGGAAHAQTVTWLVQTYPARLPVNSCKAVSSMTARGAVQKCIAKVGIALPFSDSVVTAAPVCQTTHVAISSLGVGYVYSKVLARTLTPACG
jgi:hypothetical protein